MVDLAAVAFDTLKPVVSNDFLNDPRTAPWHELASQVRLRSAVAVPILPGGSAAGILWLCSADRRAFDDEVVSLLGAPGGEPGFRTHEFRA